MSNTKRMSKALTASERNKLQTYIECYTNLINAEDCDLSNPHLMQRVRAKSEKRMPWLRLPFVLALKFINAKRGN